MWNGAPDHYCLTRSKSDQPSVWNEGRRGEEGKGKGKREREKEKREEQRKTAYPRVLGEGLLSFHLLTLHWMVLFRNGNRSETDFIFVAE